LSAALVASFAHTEPERPIGKIGKVATKSARSLFNLLVRTNKDGTMREPTIKGNAGGADGGGRRGGSLPKPDVEKPGADAVDDKLRPQRLSEIIGQRAVAERLQISLAAAQKRGEPLPHILFDGPPGLGKTTFATVLHNELGVELNITSGAALDKKMDVMPFLTNASEGSILFIDEIHRLPRAVEEFIYPVMEDFRVDVVLGEGMSARTINLPLKKFTIIGATTRSGMLSAPLRERFGMHEHLEFYDADDLARIITINAAKLRSNLVDEAAWELAARSRGTPRIANARLRWVRDYALARADGHISLSVARDALDMQEVDSEGLDKQDRRYLETLIRVFAGGPTGVEALAATMNVSVDTLKDEVEPYLLRREYVVRSPRGRQVTSAAYLHLGLPEPPPEPELSLLESQRRLFE
jgi:holliday junction DNA helicase RuvB